VAPVIRISDDTFRRLQAVSEPLIDTPSRVIDRLLLHYESRAGAAIRPPTQPSRSPAAGVDSAPAIGSTPNLFLAPARATNLRESLERSISVDAAARHLNRQQLAQLRDALGSANEFRCWAASEGKIAYFDAMRSNDLVLFAETGTARFTYSARVVTKLISEPLGVALWPDVPGLPWKLIYVLDEVRPIQISKPRLVTELGYASTYPVYGFIRVTTDRVREVVAKYGDLDRFIAACS
jgi:hypothetical protein